MHWDRFTPWPSGLSDALAIHTAWAWWVRNPFVAFLVIFLLNYYFFFNFINKNNQCNVCKYQYYLTIHTHMSEVEVYSVNKLKFWAMEKNVVGKKMSRPANPSVSMTTEPCKARHWAEVDNETLARSPRSVLLNRLDNGCMMTSDNRWMMRSGF